MFAMICASVDKMKFKVDRKRWLGNFPIEFETQTETRDETRIREPFGFKYLEF